MVRVYEGTSVRQKQIVDAVRKLIIKHGSEHVTVRGIAQEVGFSEAAVYRHFRSKKEILSLLVDHIENDLIGDINSRSSKERTPLEALDSILKSHLSAVKGRKGISFQVIAEIVSFGDRELNKKASNTIGKYISCIKELLQKAVQSKQIREDVDVEAVAIILFGTIQGLINIWALSNYRFNPQRKFEPIWNVLRATLVTR